MRKRKTEQGAAGSPPPTSKCGTASGIESATDFWVRKRAKDTAYTGTASAASETKETKEMKGRDAHGKEDVPPQVDMPKILYLKCDPARFQYMQCSNCEEVCNLDEEICDVCRYGGLRWCCDCCAHSEYGPCENLEKIRAEERQLRKQATDRKGRFVRAAKRLRVARARKNKEVAKVVASAAVLTNNERVYSETARQEIARLLAPTHPLILETIARFGSIDSLLSVTHPNATKLVAADNVLGSDDNTTTTEEKKRKTVAKKKEDCLILKRDAKMLCFSCMIEGRNDTELCNDCHATVQ